MKLIRTQTLPDHCAPKSDKLCGQWHNGWRLPDSETVAFFYGGSWWASPDRDCSPVKCGSKNEALNTK